MDLHGYLLAVRKGWWIVVLVAALGAAAGAAAVFTATPVYEAHVTFYVSAPNANSASLESTDLYLQDSATSYASLASSERLAGLVKKTAHLKLPTKAIASRVSGSAQLNTVLFVVTVQDPIPDRALAIAGAVGKDFPTMASQLNQGPASSDLVLHVVSGPSVGSSPVSPRKKLEIAAGLLVGLLLGLLLAILRDVLDTAVRTSEQLTDLTGSPVLGQVTFDDDARSSPLFIDEAHGLRRSEEFRQLRTNLGFLDAVGPTRVLVVTSSVEVEGKSTTAANLAIVAAQGGSRVLIIEADLRRPVVSDYLGLERSSGLTSILSGQAELQDVVQRWGEGRLMVLASGPIPPNPSELLGGPRMAELLVRVQRHFDMVIIDTPPLLPVTDAAVLARQADGVLLVVRHGKTKRGQVAQAVDALETVDARLVGTVLNMRPLRGVGASSYHRSSYYLPAAPASSAEDTADIGSDDIDWQDFEFTLSTASRADGGQPWTSGAQRWTPPAATGSRRPDWSERTPVERVRRGDGTTRRRRRVMPVNGVADTQVEVRENANTH